MCLLASTMLVSSLELLYYSDIFKPNFYSIVPQKNFAPSFAFKDVVRNFSGYVYITGGYIHPFPHRLHLKLDS